MDNQKEAIRDARKLGIPKMLLLGFQHMFAMFGATILVPLLVNGYFEGQGLSIQVTLVCAGLGTLFFHLCTKLKVPAFLHLHFWEVSPQLQTLKQAYSRTCQWAKSFHMHVAVLWLQDFCI